MALLEQGAGVGLEKENFWKEQWVDNEGK